MNLRRQNERMLDQFQDGILIHDAHRKITWVNEAAERITGFGRDETIGRDCFDIFSDRLCGGHCHHCQPTPESIRQMNYPIRITTKSNHLRHIDISVAPIRDDKGIFQGVMASFRDLTEVTQLRHQLKKVQSFHGIIGADKAMQNIYELIGDLAASDCPVLIQGDSGTGKELVASAIHGEGKRYDKPFVTVNCGALPEGILESELFGHVQGAFTGAIRDKKGRFELANGDIIFLDEVGDLTPGMQVKLLRVLQDHTFDRVGGDKPITVDVRVLSATNKNLRHMVATEGFREDLFYRLCVVPVHLPPLAFRRNDIPLLIHHFIDRFSQDLDRDIAGASPEAMDCLLDYPWPGNIRKLQNAIQYAFVKCKGRLLQRGHLPPEILTHAAEHPPRRYVRRGKLTAFSIAEALRKTQGNKVKAARILGVGRATLYRYLKNPLIG